MLGEHLLHRALADSVRPTTAALARLADSTALAARHGTARRMQIFATALSGQKLTLEVEGDMTVRKLREVIRAKHGIETEAVVVSVARTSDVSMEDARTLASYGVRREAELRLVNRGEQRHGRGQSAIRRTADAKQRVEKACGALSARWDQLEEQRYELASRKAALAERNSSHKPKKKLRLNVGGTPFTIQRSVLASRPRTRLGALASGIHDADLLRDKKGHIFLDLNPLCFRAIVDYLTALELGKGAVTLVVPTGLEATMAHMVEFFGISEEVGSEPQLAPAAADAEEGEPPEDVEPEPERDADDSAGWDRPIEADITGLLHAMQAQQVALKSAIDEHAAMVREFEDVERWIKTHLGPGTGNEADAPDLVYLDVAGTSVVAKRSTLIQCTESAFARRFTAEAAAESAQSEDSEDSEEDEDAGVFIKESPYCVGKIIDQLRLRAMIVADASEPEAAVLPPPPSIAEEQQETFRVVLAHYFGGCETFILAGGDDPTVEAFGMRLSQLFPADGLKLTCLGASGMNGPTSLAGYVDSPLADMVRLDQHGRQLWTVPASATYRIEAAGASGGDATGHQGGRGAVIGADFALDQGAVLLILVGQAGEDIKDSGSNCSPGGGGGTFICDNSDTSVALLVAGGGGGGRHGDCAGPGQHGQFSEQGGTTGYAGGAPRQAGSRNRADGYGGYAGAGYERKGGGTRGWVRGRTTTSGLHACTHALGSAPHCCGSRCTAVGSVAATCRLLASFLSFAA
eukprot:COSAG06_NODE_7382_length_2522_cov_8.904251_2_plen_746_part_01